MKERGKSVRKNKFKEKKGRIKFVRFLLRSRAKSSSKIRQACLNLTNSVLNNKTNNPRAKISEKCRKISFRSCTRTFETTQCI